MNYIKQEFYTVTCGGPPACTATTQSQHVISTPDYCTKRRYNDFHCLTDAQLPRCLIEMPKLSHLFSSESTLKLTILCVILHDL